ncbi:hypothetical protein P59_051 [Bacillus phage P59]|nr:hypothetical protein P59_051 [Bacillus phage P59]
MSEERKTLLQSLKDTIVFFKERKTVGRMKTEHSIFIPTELMKNQSEETEEFIKAAKAINNHPEWFCPIAAEQLAIGKVAGVEFVFTFGEDTQFDSIIAEIEQRLAK